MDLTTIKNDIDLAVRELLQQSALEPGEILVVGCSTSEVIGKKIGTAGSQEVARAILEPLRAAAEEYRIYLAIQCCEHLNRALVVEKSVWKTYGLERVEVVPVPQAGGALAAKAMELFDNPVLVEAIQAHCGIDIGSTLIGMHLRPVAVPVRLELKYIGKAPLTAARTRPKYIGGGRAVYQKTDWKT